MKADKSTLGFFCRTPIVWNFAGDPFYLYEILESLQKQENILT